MPETLAELQTRYPGAIPFRFGDSEAMSKTLIALVRSGRKRATCLAVAETAPADMPSIGRRDIATSWKGVPQLVIRTVELRLVTWANMPEECALIEGETANLTEWKIGHQAEYVRRGIFNPDMELIWERFELVEDLWAKEGGDV